MVGQVQHAEGGLHRLCLNPNMALVEELGGNRVRLTVDVSPHELEHAARDGGHGGGRGRLRAGRALSGTPRRRTSRTIPAVGH